MQSPLANRACQVHHAIVKEIASLLGMGVLKAVAATVPVVHHQHISMLMHLGN
jgi:hypothetical protein|tara:strand:- start:401 stop:559 length:159 start_codon:yes stop_codon:yes gene_type:complete